MCESGLRTIRTSMDVNRRLFLYLKSQFYKAFLAFSVNACQLNSTHINLRVSIYVTSIIFVQVMDKIKAKAKLPIFPARNTGNLLLPSDERKHAPAKVFPRVRYVAFRREC